MSEQVIRSVTVAASHRLGRFEPVFAATTKSYWHEVPITDFESTISAIEEQMFIDGSSRRYFKKVSDSPLGEIFTRMREEFDGLYQRFDADRAIRRTARLIGVKRHELVLQAVHHEPSYSELISALWDCILLDLWQSGVAVMIAEHRNALEPDELARMVESLERHDYSPVYMDAYWILIQRNKSLKRKEPLSRELLEAVMVDSRWLQTA